jgi:LPS-assembly protein
MNVGLGAPELSDLPPADPNDTRIEVLTGKAEVDLNSGAVFSDQIRIRRGDGVLTAPAARYDRATGEFSLEGGLSYRNPQAAVSGRDADFDSRTSQLRVEDAQFQIFAVPARGSAASITANRQDVLRLEDVTYTTCAEGDEDWRLRAGKIKIDRESGVATARNARLEFMGVPILYTPWISYPVTNQRKTGFLLPAVGSSATRGFEFQVPYYLNIAPAYDATLTPRYMANRGLELMTEFRYLGDWNKGRMDVEYLPNDNLTEENRYLFGWQHESMLGQGWRATLDGRAVSDPQYFEDLYGGVAATSQTHLERALDFEYFGDIWSILARFQNYQTLDESLTGADKPYQRVPQVVATAWVPDGLLGLDWRLDSEFSAFQRSTGPEGSRLHLEPGVDLPLRYRGFWLEPAAALEHTSYYIQDPEPGQDAGPTRTTPILSVDMGTIFERGDRGGSGWLQTLEPRIQYVHIPFREQDDLPVFDTIEPDFNLVQLFRTNRFLGYDRLGDTHQINMGITSRVLDAGNGTQFVTATLGQSRYFGTQDVTLPGGSPVDSNSSDWLAELGVNFRDHWKLDLGWQWDADAGQSERSLVRLQYRGDSQRALALAYRYRRDSLEEVDAAVAWPLTERWSAVARYDYSILDNQSLETFAGLEYQNCCWGLRLVYRRYLASRTGESEDSIDAQLILKGLTNVGSPADKLLERGILRYDSD